MTSINPVKVIGLALLLAAQIFEIPAERNKRSVDILNLNLNPTPDVAAENAFNADPVSWLGKNSISSVAIFTYALNQRTRVNLRNGEIFSFRFARVGTNKYVYYATPESSAGVKGYWLNTADKITINLNDGPAFVFTGELQGCSIHAKVVSNKLEVFHRNRQHLHQIYLDANRQAIDGNGAPIRELAGVTRFLDKNRNEITAVANGKISLNNGILDRYGNRITTINGKEVENLINDNVDRGTDEICQFLNYDLRGGRSVSWEQYSSNLPANYEADLAAHRTGPKFTTPFIFRKDGVWSFVSQQIQYSGSGGAPARGQIYDFQFTGKGYLTHLD
ncbi:uncharacterized protein LOC119082630 [Bradysia coprophila]|uniref:uncharacterized protein LOC119082630 n=1 Tax=Bradysia coprophila TaxID=38358 RepID=UPI00187D8A09|nr:uncharacterized protein LOC119082630 [Bradysia coprophila]